MADVVIYSTNTCPHCVAAKEYFAQKGISYTEKNVQTDMQARKELMNMGHMGVPVIFVDGEEVVGFDRDRLEQLLNK
ncbi:MAG: Glutaredoxin-like protein, YruB-family [Sporanaerobacter sp.]|uniref:glutaredoxin family protein n=1 Tax=Sporanaerobacter sp. TaxID=2010183 RepID=UPI003A100186